ncbi:unnamed protein product, partial [Polarella glacialis]
VSHATRRRSPVPCQQTVVMGKKGKKGDGEGKVKERSQWEGKHPEPKSRVDERKVMATVKLAAPVCSLLEFKLECTPSTKISFVVDRIIDRHGGSISDLSVCVNRFHPEEIASRDKTLEQCGVFGGDCIIYYDFVPRAGTPAEEHFTQQLRRVLASSPAQGSLASAGSPASLLLQSVASGVGARVDVAGGPGFQPLGAEGAGSPEERLEELVHAGQSRRDALRQVAHENMNSEVQEGIAEAINTGGVLGPVRACGTCCTLL